ncbi:MAG: hypothetical protein WAZ21_00415 [Candidatus Saccharimonadales bacterium]
MKIVAVTNYRFDKDYLEDWKENLKPLVDDYVIVHDEDGFFHVDEGEARKRQYELARKKGADWIVVLDIDERIEKRAAKKIRKIIKLLERKGSPRAVLKLNFKELYEPGRYRIDGLWGKKVRNAIFSVKEDNIFSDARLHTPREPQNEDLIVVNTDLNIYHLKHIQPELRKHRKMIYNKLDPTNEFQAIGYDYLDDENGMILEKIPMGRKYIPKCKNYEIDKRIFET